MPSLHHEIKNDIEIEEGNRRKRKGDQTRATVRRWRRGRDRGNGMKEEKKIEKKERRWGRKKIMIQKERNGGRRGRKPETKNLLEENRTHREMKRRNEELVRRKWNAQRNENEETKNLREK